MASIQTKATTPLAGNGRSSTELLFHLRESIRAEAHRFTADDTTKTTFDTIDLISGGQTIVLFIPAGQMRLVADTINSAVDALENRWADDQQEQADALANPIPTSDELIAAALASPKPSAEVPF